MIYDLTFDEAMDILNNKLGLVQGENFEKDEYLTIDPIQKVIVKNKAKHFSPLSLVCSKNIVEFWTDISMFQEEMKSQKYRFILVLNKKSVMGEGEYYSKGNSRSAYLKYKVLNANRRR